MVFNKIHSKLSQTTSELKFTEVFITKYTKPEVLSYTVIIP